MTYLLTFWLGMALGFFLAVMFASGKIEEQDRDLQQLRDGTIKVSQEEWERFLKLVE